MQKEFFDSVNTAGKQAFDAAQEVTALNASTFQTVLEKQLEIAGQIAAFNARQADIITGYKDAPSAVKAQSALAQEITEQAAANTRETVEILNKTRTAYDKLFQKSFKAANATVKKAQDSINAAA